MPGTKKSQQLHLYIPTIQVTPGLDSNKIVLLKSAYEQDYIAESQWPDDLPVYLHSVIIDTLSDSGQFASVSSRLISRDNNYKLLLKVSAFQAELAPKPSSTVNVVVAIEIFLVSSKTQKLIIHKRYKTLGKNIEVRVSTIVKALNEALSQTLDLLVKDLNTIH